MATYIYVNYEGGGLRWRNSIDARNNRNRYLAKLEEDKTTKEAEASAGRQRVDYAFRRRRRTPDEEVAVASLIQGKTTGMASYWWYLTGFQNRNDWRIYSGDTSAYVEGSDYSEDLPDDASGNDVEWSAAWLTLPVKANVCVAVMLGRRSDSYGLPSGSSGIQSVLCVNRAFLIGTKFVRQIGIPSVLQGVIDTILNPPGVDASYDEYTSDDVLISTFAPRQISAAHYGWYKAYPFSLYVTPTIYELLNKLSQFISPSQITTLPANKNWITTDFRYAGEASSETDWSYRWADWLGDPTIDSSDTSLLRTRPDMTLRLPVNFSAPLPPSYGVDPSYGSVPVSSGNWDCWDWDNSAYCRQMLLALGFTTADLTP